MKAILISFLLVALSTSVDFFDESFGMKVHKSIVKNADNSYDVTVQLKNGEELEKFAKLVIQLPEGVEFASFKAEQELLKQSSEKKQVKFIWMHLAKEKQYNLKFKIKSKLKAEDLKLNYTFWGVKMGHKVFWDWKSDWQEVK